MLARRTDGITIHTFAGLSRYPGLRHAVSDRAGGVSSGCWESLNLGLHVGDEPRRVIENRRRFCDAAGFDHARLVVAQQVHAGVAAAVTAADSGRGALDHAEAVPGADALVCAQPGVPLMALCADCPLVLLVDGPARVLGVVHASWRSIAANILPRSVRLMREMGAEAGRIRAAIGPCVGKCCYEIREGMLKTVNGSGLPADTYTERRSAGRLFFDLASAVAGQLQAAGVGERLIETAGLCTACNAGRFYSYRASGGQTGRFALLAEMAP